MVRALDPASVIAGEAVSGTPEQRWADMVAIASVIANRAEQLGVTPQQVIANTNEFNAYNRAMPAGTPSLVDMAEQAMNYVEVNGPVTDATFYATPAAANNLPNGLSFETATTGHQYFSDPQQRAIGTSLGYRQPNEFAFAANPENIPAPGFGPAPPAGELGNSWTINGVAPALGPTVEGWSAMAAADPMAAPMGSITANGLLGAHPDLSASAVASPSMGLLSSVPDTANFDMSRFGPTPTPDTSGFDMSRFGPVSTAGFDVARFGPPSIDPATNTQSFMDAPQTAIATGINSPEHKAMQANVEANLAAMRSQPSMSVPASGLLSVNPAMEATATVPSFSNAFAAQPSVTPAEQAINSIATPGMSPSQIGGYQQAANTMAQAGMLNIGQQPPTDLSGNIPANFNVLSSPMETVSIPDQPAVVAEQPTVQGPATTPAVTQQTQQAVTQQAARQSPSLSSRLSNAINPGTAIGGMLGGAALGPIGGLIGAMLGNSVSQNGGLSGLSGLLGNQAPTMNMIGVGPAAAYGIYGGGYAPGSTAIASDGSTISAQAGGDVARTNSFGVTDVENSYGGYAGDFSGWY